MIAMTAFGLPLPSRMTADETSVGISVPSCRITVYSVFLRTPVFNNSSVFAIQPTAGSFSNHEIDQHFDRQLVRIRKPQQSPGLPGRNASLSSSGRP